MKLKLKLHGFPFVMVVDKYWIAKRPSLAEQSEPKFGYCGVALDSLTQ